MAIKRLHYFNHQFLKADDFTAEQDYHIHMRHHHNRVLHSPGIAEGLELHKVGDREVLVKPGTAIDERGREIVVEAEVKCGIDEKAPHREGFVMAKFAQTESDHHVQEGVEGHTRWTESANVEIVFERPADAVLLGRLELDPYGVIQKIDHSVRKYVREALADGSVSEEKLTAEVRVKLNTRPEGGLAENSVHERHLTAEVRAKLVERESIREHNLAPDVRAKLVENESIHEHNLAPALREKLDHHPSVSGWVRLPFKPAKMTARRPPHNVDAPEFLIDAGVTYCATPRGAKGWMSIPIPPGVQRVTAFRLAGETASRLTIHIYKSSWNALLRRCEVKQILTREVFNAALHDFPIAEADQYLDPELEALSLVVTASGPCEICLVAVHFE